MPLLQEQILDIREQYDAALADGRITIIEGMKILGKIGTAVEQLAETFVGSDERFEQELAAARVAYNQYIAPLDIPSVPNIIEGWIDQGIIGGIEEGARYLRRLAIERNPELAGR